DFRHVLPIGAAIAAAERDVVSALGPRGGVVDGRDVVAPRYVLLVGRQGGDGIRRESPAQGLVVVRVVQAAIRGHGIAVAGVLHAVAEFVECVRRYRPVDCRRVSEISADTEGVLLGRSLQWEPAHAGLPGVLQVPRTGYLQ